MYKENEWTELSEDAFAPVCQARHSEAVQRLDKTPFVELSDEDAARFVGNASFKPADGRPYLIRGLALRNYYVTRKVRYRNQKVWVFYGALSRWVPLKEVKAPYVVWLPFQPQEVYVSGVVVS